MRIYYVLGETGEYEDREEWVVCAYKRKEYAEQHVDAANKVTADFFRRNARGSGDVIAVQALGTCENPYDEKMQMGYNGTKYYMEHTELLESFE